MSLASFQAALKAAGLDPGEIDGRWGPKTEAAALVALRGRTSRPAALSQDELDEYIRDEGFRSAVYQDSLGWWTIGIGRLVDGRKGGGISQEEAAYLLANDLAAKERELDHALPWWRTMTVPRQRALRNMAFNLGVEGLLKFKNTLAAMQRGDYAAAAAGMRGSLWAKQVKGRAERLARIMEAG